MAHTAGEGASLLVMTAANALYDALGFRRIAPYYANPHPDVLYKELELG